MFLPKSTSALTSSDQGLFCHKDVYLVHVTKCYKNV